jgi:hypothetical protein
VLHFRLHEIEDRAWNNFLEGHQWHEVGIGLADNEVVDIEKLG